jgi:hypothetical protein
VIEEEDLDSTVLTFYGASFGFERALRIGALDLALFTRRETESEAKFRPRIVRRWLLVPRAWLFLDKNREVLVLGKDGKRPASTGTIGIQNSEGTRPPPRFEEQGIPFRTEPVSKDLELYVVSSMRDAILSEEGCASLGIPHPSGG